jgi:hypothetical protein
MKMKCISKGKRAQRWTGLILVALTLVLAGCGGGGSTTNLSDSTTVAVPDTTSTGMINRALAQEATRQLGYFCQLQESYFENNHKYASSPLELQGFTEDDLKTSGSIVNFEIKLVKVQPDNFIFHAIADDMDGDGTQSIWEVDNQCEPHEVVAD